MRRFYAIYVPSGEAIAADLTLCEAEQAKMFDSPPEVLLFINSNFELVTDENGDPLFDVERIEIQEVS